MRVLAALLLAVPLSTLAQAAPPAAPAPAEPEWSLGAGVSFDGLIFRGSFTTFATPLVSAFVPGVAASLERRLSARSWLVLGATAFWRSNRQDVPAGAFGISRWEDRQVRAALGVRHALTGPGAPVEVSLLALADAGYSSVDATLVQTANADQEASAWTAGASLGLALERELTSRLSLRVASPLASLGYLATRQRQPGQGATKGHDFSAGLALAPRLELRLAF